ncbi:hypothetical protein [Aeoliella sp. SH292]|uniref:hypothetical protein n=1 Tax=Aeoliella sp. SH292 TaxID=3454464 RepID=UPI003F98038C
MAKIACPECKKVYDVPEQALGRTATCKCGKKFRLGNKPVVATANATATTASKSTPQPAAQASAPRPKPNPVEVASPPSKPSESFWDDALAEPVKKAVPAREPQASMGSPYQAAQSKPSAKPKRKKAARASWGVDWTKVGGGGLAFVLGGGGCALLWMSGYINIWLIIVTVGGLFTMLTGLMGEEGIW